jgi:hypothetical protein
VRETLSRSGAGCLYVRFFDVVRGAADLEAHPVAPIRLEAPFPAGVAIVPVVYLANAVFLGREDAERLADRVWTKLDAMAQTDGIRFKQLQIDCDWSEESRAPFFRFAARLKKRAAERGATLSATIRLHQVKYFARTGVPPVDSGMLMFYNMGRLGADGARPSIFNAEDAGRYASSIAAYPLPLDLALPIFSWLVQSRDGRVIGLVENTEASELETSQAFSRSGPGTFLARRSLFLHGRYFKKGDFLRLEETGPIRTCEAAVLAARGAGAKTFGTVAFFDLDEQRVKQYAPKDFAAILRTFN